MGVGGAVTVAGALQQGDQRSNWDLHHKTFQEMLQSPDQLQKALAERMLATSKLVQQAKDTCNNIHHEYGYLSMQEDALQDVRKAVIQLQQDVTGLKETPV